MCMCACFTDFVAFYSVIICTLSCLLSVKSLAACVLLVFLHTPTLKKKPYSILFLFYCQ